MTDTNDYSDPRMDLSVDVTDDQVYADARTGDEYRVVYVDDTSVILRLSSDGQRSTRLEPRSAFEEAVGADRFELTEPSVDSPPMPDEYDEIRALFKRYRDRYTDEGGRVAAHKVEVIDELVEAFEELVAADADPMDFESVAGIGAKAAENLRDAGYVTEHDVAQASVDQLTDVPWVGESNAEALLEAVQ